VAVFMWAEFSVCSLYGEWQVIYTSIYPVLQILYYYILTYTHPHIPATKAHRRAMETFYQRQCYLQICCTYIYRNSTKNLCKKYKYPTQNAIQYIHAIYIYMYVYVYVYMCVCVCVCVCIYVVFTTLQMFTMSIRKL
jgi:hypothetical protein